MDMKGVGLSKASQVYSYVRQASSLSQNYYPERLGKLYIINAPWGFSGVWTVVRAWLDPVTVAKIHILGSNYQKELLDQVPIENLPIEFGGTCECEEGCMLSDMGPWREKEWARPAKWEKNGDDNAIQNVPAEVTDGGAANGAELAPTAQEPAAELVPASAAT
jgi:hypothetical protein